MGVWDFNGISHSWVYILKDAASNQEHPGGYWK